MNNTASKIREKRFLPATRQPNPAEIEKALNVCLNCLNNIKDKTGNAKIESYIAATVTAANMLTIRN